MSIRRKISKRRPARKSSLRRNPRGFADLRKRLIDDGWKIIDDTWDRNSLVSANTSLQSANRRLHVIVFKDTAYLDIMDAFDPDTAILRFRLDANGETDLKRTISDLELAKETFKYLKSFVKD